MSFHGTPLAKHDLLILQAPQTLESSDQVLSKLISNQSHAAANGSRKLAVVYSYKEDSPRIPLSSKLEVLGYCSIHVASHLLSASDKWRSCHLGVKRADGAHRSSLTGDALKNSTDFASFIKNELLNLDRVAILGCDSKGRCGIVTCTLLDVRNSSSTTSLKEEYCGYEYFASCYIISMDDIRSCVVKVTDSDKAHHGLQSMATSVQTTKIEDVQLWKPPVTADDDSDLHLHPQMSFSSLDKVDYTTTFIDLNQNSADTSISFNASRKRNYSQLESSSARNGSFHSDSGAAAADKFYSNLTRSLDTRSSSRLFHMRNFNGWVKACQIAELSPQTTLNQTNSVKAQKKPTTRHNHPLRVLDLACGKGGDLGKWLFHDRGVQNYVGIDVARGSLKDAAIRARSMRDSFKHGKCTFICADLGADLLRPPPSSHLSLESGENRETVESSTPSQLLCWSLAQELRDERGEPKFSFTDYGGISMDESFDVVSIQFAIHYMMSTRQRAMTFFRTVSDLLDVGGNLIITTIDARVVLEYILASGYNIHETTALDENLQDRDEYFVINIANGTCRLKFHKDIIKRMFTQTNRNTFNPLDDQYFGLEYVFTLVEGDDHSAGVGEAVDLPEWLTPLPVLEALAQDVGFKLDYASNFHEFYSHRKNPVTHAKAHSALYNMKVLNRNGSVSNEEWEISRLYVALKFTKIKG